MSGLKIDVLSVAKDFIPSSVSQQRTSPPTTTTMSIRKRKLSMAHNIYWKVAVYFFGGCCGSGNLQIVAEWLRSKLPESESLSKVLNSLTHVFFRLFDICLSLLLLP